MEELTIKNYNGINVTDSREVAEMIGKKHAHLMRDIQGYEKVISENPKLDSQNFFIKDTYKVEGNNKTYDCYLLTKQGCEMVANKMTGEKGILFTAEYVQAFNKMEEHIKKQISIDEIVDLLKGFINEHERIKKELKEKTEIINQINKCLNGTRHKVEMTEEEFRSRIVEFINENDVVLKSHPKGLVIDKDALYKYMAEYGWTQHDVLDTLDNYKMIYHSTPDRTQHVRINGKMRRELIIN